MTYERAQLCADGNVRHVRVAFAPERATDGTVKGSYALVTDVTAYKEAEEAIRTHAVRQEAIAIYGQYALETRDIDKLIANAAAISTSGLDVTHSAVYRAVGAADPLLQIAGVGWRADAPTAVARQSSTGRALLAGQPVIIDDLRSAGADVDMHIIAEGLLSGMEVAIPTSDGAFGVIGAYSRERGSIQPGRRQFFDVDRNLARHGHRTQAGGRTPGLCRPIRFAYRVCPIARCFAIG